MLALTLGADARDTAKNKKKGPASPQTGSPGSPATERSLGGGTRRVGGGPEGGPARGGRPRACSGKRLRPRQPGGRGVSGARRGSWGAGLGAGGLGEREGAAIGELPGTRAACSPPAAAPAVARRCRGPAPRSPGQPPAAAGLVLPSARGSVQRRRVRGLRSGESPPSGRRPRRAEEAASEREEARPTAPDSRPRSARALARGRGAAGAGKSLVAPSSTSSQLLAGGSRRAFDRSDRPCRAVSMLLKEEKRRAGEGPRQTALPPYPATSSTSGPEEFSEPRADHTHRHTRSLAHVVLAETAQIEGPRKTGFREYLLTNLSFPLAFPGGLISYSYYLSALIFWDTPIRAAEKTEGSLPPPKRDPRTFSVWSLEKSPNFK